MHYATLLHVGLFNTLGKEKNIKITFNFIVYFDSVPHHLKLYVDWHITTTSVISKLRWRTSRSIAFLDALRTTCTGSENVKRIQNIKTMNNITVIYHVRIFVPDICNKPINHEKLITEQFLKSPLVEFTTVKFHSIYHCSIPKDF